MRLLALVGALALLALGPPPGTLPGFTIASSAREKFDELRFLDLPSAQGTLDNAGIVAGRPHYAGSKQDRDVTNATADLLRSYGFAVQVESWRAIVDTPRHLAVELNADGRFYKPRDGFHKQRGTAPLGLDLHEVGDPADPDTENPAIGLPFNAGSANGDVDAPLVYAHHGLPEDFATLRQAGVDVRGAVVLIRYGRAFRGLLAQNAQNAGAAGVIFYSDPADDPTRPLAAVQRGALGPGIRIPVLPVSADNARILLRPLRGASGPDGWRGALDAPYPVGKGPARVHLVVTMNHERRTLWNTIGTLRGTAPGQSVVLGGHRDAWTYGAGDNGGGTTTLLETARGLGYLAQSGWRPKRNVVVALWDAEEIGTLGSEEFARRHRTELSDGCVAYINADENLTGRRFGAAAAGVLAPAIVAATRMVADPARDRTSLHDRWNAQPRGITIANPGGGSDHASFLFGIGTPTAEMGFEGPFGVYHSGYDTMHYAWTVSDPGFVLHRTSAQLYGIVAMRLAAADAVPYAFAELIPVLSSGMMRLQAQAQRDGRALDLAPLQAAIARFGAVVRPGDDAIAAGGGPDGTRALFAAQTLDRVAYGMNGYQAIAFPAVTSAYAARDDAALRAAVLADAASIDRATAALR
ncbi:MAG TPA: M28 family peptidase [Candidatus Elarobacter sp.]